MAKGPEQALAVSQPGRAVGLELRERAVAAVVQEGMSARAAAARFGLAARSVSRWVRRFRERGHVRADARTERLFGFNGTADGEPRSSTVSTTRGIPVSRPLPPQQP